jgi:hypothetical protein
MKLEHYKPRSARAARRKEKLKRKGKISKSKSRMLAVAQEWKPPRARALTSPQLREAYSTKIEWARKLIPKLKKEAEAPEEKGA